MQSRMFAAAMLSMLVLAAGPACGAASLPPVEKIVLSNRLTVMVSENHSLPFVTVRLLVDAGSGSDPQGKAGLANLTAQSLLLGTETRTVEAINRDLDFIGANLSASCDRDSAALQLKVLKKHLHRGVEIFLDCLRRPAFPAAEITAEIDRILGRIQARQDQPGAVAENAFYRALFPESAFGHPVIGTTEALKAIRRSDVADFFAAAYRPQNAVIAVVGDITAAVVKSVLVSPLESWPSGSGDVDAGNVQGIEEAQTIRIDRDISQAHIIVGHRGIARPNEDYPAVAVMNHILGGGGFSSRLVQEIRVERGWAYSVRSRFAAYKRTGAFQVVVQTRNETAPQALQVIQEGIRRMRREPVSEQELQTAQQYLTGSFPLRFDTRGELAGFLCGLHHYRLGLDYPRQYVSRIESVSVADVQQAARNYLHPEGAVRVVVGNLEKAGIQ